jgi:hypothetical protein
MRRDHPHGRPAPNRVVRHTASLRSQVVLPALAIAVLAAFAATAGLAAGAGPAAAQTGAPPAAAVGTVVIVHGLDGVPADVYLDGATSPALAGFDPRRVTDPLALPVGRHQADIRRAGDPPDAVPLMSGTFFVVAGQRITAAALLDPQGAPSWLVFANDGWTMDGGGSALRFRHLAASGPVSLVVDGRPAGAPFTNLAVGSQGPPVSLSPGRHTVRVDDASGRPLVAEQAVTLSPGTITNLYLTGRADAGPLGLLAEAPTAASAGSEVVALQATPAFIATGDSGLAAPRADDGPAAAVRWSIVVLAGTGGLLAAGLLAGGLLAGGRAVRRIAVR